jgi:hypothetical protein
MALIAEVIESALKRIDFLSGKSDSHSGEGLMLQGYGQSGRVYSLWIERSYFFSRA